MDIKYIKSHDLVLLDCISGSTAYGLNTPQSDVDKRGVFFLPKKMFYGSSGAGQISNDSNDESYTELGRFFELLSKSNPTMIELLHTPDESIISKHALFHAIKKEWYLTKRCKDTFAGYAVNQIRKARGLNKKVLNPMGKERKTVLDFCFVPSGQGSMPVMEFLNKKGIDQSRCGLSKIPHMVEMYGMYVGDEGKYRGIVRSEKANEVSLSSVGKEEQPFAIMSFNKSGYSTYCKEYKAYWEWVDRRNDERYKSTLNHGKNYDAKNMMHTFRLLEMANEIAREGIMQVKRPDRSFLLKIRNGDFEYDELLALAEERIAVMEEAYAKSDLPEKPDTQALEEVLVEFRQELYQ